MKLPFNIIQLLKTKSGNMLRQPSDCEYLSLDIESKTGVRIGINGCRTICVYEKRWCDGRTNWLPKRITSIDSQIRKGIAIFAQKSIVWVKI